MILDVNKTMQHPLPQARSASSRGSSASNRSVTLLKMEEAAKRAELQDRWRRHARRISSHEARSLNNIKFVDFVNFVQDEVKILLDPLFGKHSSEARSARTAQPRPTGRSMRGSVLATSASTGPKCWYCEEGHHLQNCPTLRAKPIEKRREFFMKESLCFGCCRRGHRVSHCRSRRSCALCKRRHLTVLHQEFEGI